MSGNAGYLLSALAIFGMGLAIGFFFGFFRGKEEIYSHIMWKTAFKHDVDPWGMPTTMV